jgi:glycosyltransferase involved in cell wall biosynthesis
VLVSVIIPVYNSEKYLDRALQSVINQTHKNLQIIIVDDGSTDKSLEIVTNYQKTDYRIEIYVKENSGVANTRNLALSKVKGEYIYFMDSDDTVVEDAIESLLRIGILNKNDIVVGNYCDCNEQGEVIRTVVNPSNIKKENDNVKLNLDILYGKPALWNKLFKYDLIKGEKFINIKKSSDSAFTYIILNKAESIGFLDKVVYYYFIREGSISTNPNKNLIDIIHCWEYIIERYKKVDSPKDTLNALNEISFRHYLFQYISSFKLYDKTEKLFVQEELVNGINGITKPFNVYSLVAYFLTSKLVRKSNKVQKFISNVFYSKYIYKLAKKFD